MARLPHLLFAVVVALSAAACGDGGDGGDATETTGPTAVDTPVDEATSAEPTEVTTSEATEPSGEQTSVDEVVFTQANVTMDITGAFERNLTLGTVIGSQYGGEQPNVLISVTDSAEAPTATFNLVFPIGTTTAEIDETGAIYLAYSAQDDAGTEHVFFNIEAGSCSITVEQASPDGVSGTWECPQNAATGDPDVVVDASGTFSAAP